MSDFFDSAIDFINEHAMLLLIICGSILLFIILIMLIRSLKRPPLVENLKDTFFFMNLLLLRTHNKLDMRQLYLILEMKINVKRKKQTTDNCQKSLLRRLKMENIDLIACKFEISRVDLIFTDLRLQENRHLVKDSLDFSNFLDYKKKKTNQTYNKDLTKKEKLERKQREKEIKDEKLKEESEQKQKEHEMKNQKKKEELIGQSNNKPQENLGTVENNVE